MARVIVILALMLLISALIFGLTRKQGAGVATAVDAEAHATVPLADAKDGTTPPSIGADIVTGSDKPAAAAVQTAQDVMSGMAAGAAPAFSTVGVDNRGRGSFTGTASPGDEVSILHDGKALGSGITDHAGNWTIDFKVPSVREDYPLELSARRSGGQVVQSPQRAVVSPPDETGGLQHITLETIESKSNESATAKPGEPDVGIVIDKVDTDKDGSAVLKGKSDPGAVVHASIDGRPAGDTTVGADGKWVLAVRNDTGKSASGVLLVLSSADGHELDRAEVPLKLSAVEVKTAEQQTPAGPKVPVTVPAKPEPAHTTTVKVPASPTPVVAHGAGKTGHYVKVRRGDSLWRIAHRHYGNGRRWTRIYNANKRKIHDPDFLRPGHRIYLPD